MNLERRVIVVLDESRRAAGLIRYAANVAGRPVRVAALTPVTGNLPVEFQPEPPVLTTGNGEPIVLTGLDRLHFVQVSPATDAADAQASVVRLRERVENVLGAQTSALEFDCAVESGVRGAEILQRAAATPSDVVLVSDRRLACHLVAAASCSVWFVPPGGATAISRILVPVDLSNRAADALRVATALARQHGANACWALHAYFDACTITGPDRAAQVHEQLTAALTHFAARVDPLGVAVTPLVREGSKIAGTILRTAQEHAADLIVMHSRGRTPAAGFLERSHAVRVLRETATPLLIVKHFGVQRSFWNVLRDRLLQRPEQVQFC